MDFTDFLKSSQHEMTKKDPIVTIDPCRMRSVLVLFGLAVCLASVYVVLVSASLACMWNFRLAKK
jgi:hypothetical protein